MATDYIRLMNIWLHLPENTESVRLVMNDQGMGEFDVNQPTMRGVIECCGGFEMPFFCVIANMNLTDLQNGSCESTQVVITTYRHGERWLSTLLPGRRPDFRPENSVEMPASFIEDMIEGKIWTNYADQTAVA